MRSLTDLTILLSSCCISPVFIKRIQLETGWMSLYTYAITWIQNALGMFVKWNNFIDNHLLYKNTYIAYTYLFWIKHNIVENTFLFSRDLIWGTVKQATCPLNHALQIAVNSPLIHGTLVVSFEDKISRLAELCNSP